jgi:hypothetical protein
MPHPVGAARTVDDPRSALVARGGKNLGAAWRLIIFESTN